MPHKVTEMAVVFVGTIDHSLRLLNDFSAILTLSEQLITESFQEWYTHQHIEATPEELALTEIMVNDRKVADIRREHTQFFLQTILVRGFEAYLTYLGDLHQLLYATVYQNLSVPDPEIRRLIHNLLADHQKTRSRRREDLTKDLRERFHLPLLRTKEEQDQERQIAIVRNLIVHHRAIMDTNSVGKLPAYPAKAGETLAFTRPGVQGHLAFLSTCITAVDEQAITRYSLPFRTVKDDGRVE